MSLDFYLEADEPHAAEREHRIFVRRDGQNVEVSREEWDRLNPGREPIATQPDPESRELYWGNITHNLRKMAAEAGLYACLWRPDENGIRRASEMVNFLEAGLEAIKADPERFRRFNPPNGWGKYENLVVFAEGILAACKIHPHARVIVSR